MNDKEVEQELMDIAGWFTGGNVLNECKYKGIKNIKDPQKLFNTPISNTCYINDDGFEDERFL